MVFRMAESVLVIFQICWSNLLPIGGGRAWLLDLAHPALICMFGYSLFGIVVVGSSHPPWCLGKESLSTALKLYSSSCVHQDARWFSPLWRCSAVCVASWFWLARGGVWCFSVVFSKNLLQSLSGIDHGLVWCGALDGVNTLLVMVCTG